MKNLYRSTLAMALSALALSAQAGTVGLTLSVDNYFGLYTGDGTSASNFVDANDSWATGESYTLTVNQGDYIYVAAWGDDGGYNGFLSQMSDATGTVFSQDARWQVTATGIDLDFFSQLPSLALMTQEIGKANAGLNASGGWVNPDIGPLNNGGTWPHVVTNISTSAEWIWHDAFGGGNSHLGANHDEFLIFRIDAQPVPEPGTIAAIGAGLAAFSRRRKKA